jgi:hypothetical protein
VLSISHLVVIGVVVALIVSVLAVGVLTMLLLLTGRE